MVTYDHGLSKRESNGSVQHRDRVSPTTGSQSRNSMAKNNERRTAEAAQGGLGVAAAAAQATLPSWATMVLMVSLIFGGCCSNVGVAP